MENQKEKGRCFHSVLKICSNDTERVREVTTSFALGTY